MFILVYVIAHKFSLGNFDYVRVDKFCYLGDSAAGGKDASSITQIRIDLKKIRE